MHVKRPIAMTVLAFLPWLGGCQYVEDALWGPQAGRIPGDSFSADSELKRLAVAVDQGDEAAIAAAIQAGADVNGVGKGGFRLLYWAVARNNPAGFETLLKNGADINADYLDPDHVPKHDSNYTVLERVLASDNAAFVTAALRQGMNPDYIPIPSPFDQRALLFFAVQAGSFPVTATLLAHGANPNPLDVSGHSPLVCAGMCCNYNMAWFLLERGADPTIQDNKGRDFTDILKQYGSAGVWKGHEKSFEAIVNELIKRGLLTRQDIVEADKPKTSAPGEGPPGITVIEHAPDSEIGQAILKLDEAEREANRREGR
jgi:ankyrin repeat protein